MNKRIICALYTLIVVCIGFATIIEKYRGTSFVGEHIYGAWWFSALWALLTVSACAYIIEQKLYKRVALFLLHMSFVVILAGALTTHLFARRGTIMLRTDVAESTYIDKEGKVEHLPFSLTLREFRIVNYPGTDAPLDYQSVIRFTSQKKNDGEIVVSMNNIGHIAGYRFHQSSYDTDGKGVTLGISYDPYGIAITYSGYLMLLLGIIATLLSQKTQMRTLYRKAITIALLMVSINADARLEAVDKDIAHRIGTINVLYNNRICPLNTVATDFVTKLSGRSTWESYSADEIFVSWMIYYSPWKHQRLIRVKNRDIRQLLGISGQWASYSDFLNEYHEYKLGDAVDELRMTGRSTINERALKEADEKFHLIEMFYRGEFIRMFPYVTEGLPTCTMDKETNGEVNWYSPGGQSLPREIPVKEQFFIKQSMDFLTESIVTGQRERAFEIIAKIKLFQHEMIGDLLPGEGRTRTEIAYNTLRSQRWPVFLALTLSLLLCVVMLFSHRLSILGKGLIGCLFIYVSLLLVLRWWLSGHIPVSNGHETMLFMAWAMLLLTILLYRKFPIIMGFGSLVASFCLLVATLAGSNSQLTPLMPVLQSPLLSIHVMTVMCAYALFALQALIGLHFLMMSKADKWQNGICETALSQLLLYPAVFLLAIGIFLGAVWANVSWGNYWSWDPKESWALITFMLYSVPLHRTSITLFDKPLYYHLYMISAFLAVLTTYFGVNYLLGGMHSYA